MQMTDGYPPQQALVSAESQRLAGEDFTGSGETGGEDHSAYAPGRICVRCDRVIDAGQPARRRGESGWAHETCPEIGG
jgi:hypothetical protein